MPLFSPKRRPSISWPLQRDSGTVSSYSSKESSILSRGHSSKLSNSTNSTVLTSLTSPLGSYRTVSIDIDEYFAQFRDDIELACDYPSKQDLSSAGEVPVYDGAGNARPFKSLFSGDTAIGERQLVIFVRHFYCGACQAYLKALTESITLETYFSIPTPTSITIIGCGSPSMIADYKAMTGTPFPIFADPTRRLYKLLGMTWTLDSGPVRPDYMKNISKPAWVAGQIKQLATTKGTRQKFRGGNPLQVGGEFLFQDGEVLWCHRMKNFRDHTEIDVLRRVLEIDD